MHLHKTQPNGMAVAFLLPAVLVSYDPDEYCVERIRRLTTAVPFRADSSHPFVFLTEDENERSTKRNASFQRTRSRDTSGTRSALGRVRRKRLRDGASHLS